MEGMIQVLGFLSDSFKLALIIGGTTLGVFIGALPGLGSMVMIALLLPFVVHIEPVTGIALTAIIYCAATYGGSITAILINTPGTAAAAATTFDGYPLARKGEAGRALGVTTFASAIAGTRNHEPRLFNVVEDPLETRNLAGMEEHAVLIGALHDLLFADLDLEATTAKAAASKQTRLFLHNVLKGSEGYHWDYQPKFDATKQYVRGVNKPETC